MHFMQLVFSEDIVSCQFYQQISKDKYHAEDVKQGSRGYNLFLDY